MSWGDLRVKQIKVQRRIFRDRERKLTKAEYMRLLNAARAKGNPRLYWLMQTPASTGIRVSELQFVSTDYYSSSSDFSAQKLMEIAREHWKAESMRWILDVVLSEDFSAFHRKRRTSLNVF